MNQVPEYAGGLKDKVALVTGAASGIGESIARRLAAHGCRLGLLDLDEEGCRALARELAGLPLIADVSDSDAFDKAVDRLEAEFGTLNILINNAGINGSENMARVTPRIERQMDEVAETGQPAVTPLSATAEMSDHEWQQMMSVNLSSVFYGTRRALRSMQAQGKGVIVNMASVCGMTGCAGFPHYSAAKAGVIGLTRSVAKEVAHTGVRVNAVAPGFIDTPLQKETGQRFLDALRLQIPAGKLGEPDAVAALVCFLCSSDSDYLIGQTLSPNGGFLT